MRSSTWSAPPTAGPRERILEVAREHFFRHGFSRVTMDEIAHELGMSKRTLYTHCSSKKDLLRQALIGKVDSVSEGLTEILGDGKRSFPVKFREVFHFLTENLPRPSPAFLRDIPRTAPEVWNEVDQIRLQVLRRHFSVLFQKGGHAGYIRPEVDRELFLRIFTTLAQHLINPEMLSRLPYTADQMFEAVFDLVMRGVLTEKGRNLCCGPRAGE